MKIDLLSSEYTAHDAYVADLDRRLRYQEYAESMTLALNEAAGRSPQWVLHWGADGSYWIEVA